MKKLLALLMAALVLLSAPVSPVRADGDEPPADPPVAIASDPEPTPPPVDDGETGPGETPGTEPGTAVDPEELPEPEETTAPRLEYQPDGGRSAVPGGRK